MTKTCPTCGKEFDSKEPEAKFCSRECLYESRRKKRFCPICGKRMQGGKETTCSRECGAAWRNRKKIGQTFGGWKFVDISPEGCKMQCTTCGAVETMEIPSDAKQKRCWSCNPAKSPRRELKCELCGKPFETHYATARFCSVECYDKARAAEKVPCIVCGALFVPKSRENGKKEIYCNKECYLADIGAKHMLCVCQECGKEFHPKDSHPANTCSPECREKQAKRVLAKRESEQQHRGELLKKICEVCKAPFTASCLNQKVCSENCAKERARQQSKESYKRRFPNTDRHRKKEKLCASTCTVCGKSFATVKENGAKFCSKRCARNAHKESYEYRQYFEEVYKRDGGVCQLCGRPVAEVGATLDHIIPKSKGGSHTPDNLQLAHMTCNSAKGARENVQIVFEQIALGI